ncbi:hypothetical protein PF005_g6053 [Phytophthora fragariae]|uniref:Tc1-like transposase DDE domain-containing protein n=1 Tax=Phytophthora fragariae TaxID=53985 RepID=A0A6A3UAQ9_9STRA|nr:hypothetical protein PF003_g11838 [Phytophthora fragariae]KAE8943836.1 hypothetical protein PF009_g6469 [Phytophthora fragariae]KAE9020637.1 hypothetical protein PF011_g5318 [Phytophthora fragariae]KAE9126246.1 hypothetical protein PF010_g5338 [Phytophthora fragariae]KAE9132407.1 hypothetical protein PF007_g3724 [Phytophthora fragariae]
MDVNAEFVKSIYATVKASDTYREYFADKKVVIVLDNAPAHNQVERRRQTKVRTPQCTARQRRFARSTSSGK